MKSKRVTSMLDWIDTNSLYIHYSHINNLYYTLVEIIDSITSIEEIEEYGFDYFSVKNTFHKMLVGKEMPLQKLMFEYCYPNIKSEDIENFCNSLLKLFEIRYQQTVEERKDVNALNEIQVANILLVNKLRTKSDAKNRGFLHSVTAQCEIDKLNMLFDLVSAKSKDL